MKKCVVLKESKLRQIVRETIMSIINEEYHSSNNGGTIIIYHSIDWDGFTSAAVASLAHPGAELYGWNYSDPVPDVSNYSKVILVDLTISPKGDYSWMEENANKLIWIDHHANAMNYPGLEKIEGLMEDGVGACILAWEYFFGDNIPMHVALCGTYDVFRKDGKYADWEDAWAYQLALNKEVYLPRKQEGFSKMGVDVAIQFIQEDKAETLERINRGMELESERARQEEECFKTAVFSERNGMKICKVVVGPGTPAQNIKNNMDKHTADVFLLRRNEPAEDGIYAVSIRVPERSDVDASAIAREYGGNGHIKAAGCGMTLDEFNNF